MLQTKLQELVDRENDGSPTRTGDPQYDDGMESGRASLVFEIEELLVAQAKTETYTYTKQQLLDCAFAFKKFVMTIIEPPFMTKRDAILAVDEFKDEFRKIVPNSLWK